MTGTMSETIFRNDTGWIIFENPVRTEAAYFVGEVFDVIKRVEQAVERDKLFAAGFVSYEAAPAFDSAYETFPPDGFPLVWFRLYRRCREYLIPDDPVKSSPIHWRPVISRDEYDRSFAAIEDMIADGRTYQVNYTFRLLASAPPDPASFFTSVASACNSRYSAFIDTGDYTICSFSPELFFECSDGRIECRPMKGTMHRGKTIDTDRELGVQLMTSEKNRAENVMIVDMIRNDLGKIARPGSVKVLSLWDVERYPTVWQMTSTVTASVRSEIVDIFRALFPCASVTGAPKVSTMNIIRKLETSPRHIYTGSIGYITPGKNARFNVAIRTILIDKKRGVAEYGVGSGIVCDSANKDEYDECLIKADVVATSQPRFSLLETLLWEPIGGYFLLDRHLSRLKNAAEYFCFSLDIPAVELALREKAASFDADKKRVRLTVSRNGAIHCVAYPVDTDGQDAVRVGLAKEPADSHSPFLYFKTTFRDVYEKAREGRPECDDILLWNERAEITESTIANVVIELDGTLYTPPVESGLLAGTYREELLERGEIRERVIRVDELDRCDAVYLINSVRKWRQAILVR